MLTGWCSGFRQDKSVASTSKRRCPINRTVEREMRKAFAILVVVLVLLVMA